MHILILKFPISGAEYLFTFVVLELHLPYWREHTIFAGFSGPQHRSSFLLIKKNTISDISVKFWNLLGLIAYMELHFSQIQKLLWQNVWAGYM